MSAVEECEQTIATLQTKLDAATKRVDEITGERQRLGYLIHVDKDAPSRKALDAFNTEVLNLAGEIESLRGAISESEKRLTDARRSVDLESAKTNAAAARAVLEEMRVAAADIDEAFGDAVESIEELFAALDKLHQLGIEYPTTNQLNSLGLRVTQTWIGRSRFARAVELLAPGARREMLPLITEWAANVESNRLAPLLGEPEQSAAAPATATAAIDEEAA